MADDGALARKEQPADAGTAEVALTWLERIDGQWKIAAEYGGLPADFPASLDSFERVESVPYRGAEASLMAAIVEGGVCFLVTFPDTAPVPGCQDLGAADEFRLSVGYLLMRDEQFEYVIGWGEAPTAMLRVEPAAPVQINTRFDLSYFALVLGEPGTFQSMQAGIDTDTSSALELEGGTDKLALEPVREELRNEFQGIRK